MGSVVLLGAKVVVGVLGSAEGMPGTKPASSEGWVTASSCSAAELCSGDWPSILGDTSSQEVSFRALSVARRRL